MVKRSFDLLCSAAGLFLLAPMFLAVACLIKRDSSGPVFFRQTRMGQHGKPFAIYKFRTMCHDAEKKGAQVSSGDDPRITPVGRLLRKYKIDELPQLLNVFWGEMSLVGPRPEVPKYVEAYKEEYREILEIKPGITDFASIEFRNENELLKTAQEPELKYLEEILPVKIEYYRKYLREQSLKTDVILIFRTVMAIVR